MYGIWTYLSPFSRVCVFILKLRSGSGSRFASVWKVGSSSGSASNKNPDPDSDRIKKSESAASGFALGHKSNPDPHLDPHKSDTDPQHCPRLLLGTVLEFHRLFQVCTSYERCSLEQHMSCFYCPIFLSTVPPPPGHYRPIKSKTFETLHLQILRSSQAFTRDVRGSRF